MLVVRPPLVALGLCSVRTEQRGSCRNILLLRTRRQTNKTPHLLLLSLTVTVSLYRRRVPTLSRGPYKQQHLASAHGGGESPSAQTDTNEIAYKQKWGTRDNCFRKHSSGGCTIDRASTVVTGGVYRFAATRAISTRITNVSQCDVPGYVSYPTTDISRHQRRDQTSTLADISAR